MEVTNMGRGVGGGKQLGGRGGGSYGQKSQFVVASGRIELSFILE